MNLSNLNHTSKPEFMTEEQINEALVEMENNSTLNTQQAYVNDGLGMQTISFRQKHIVYLKDHPKVNPESYLSNLRTMLKIRN